MTTTPTDSADELARALERIKLEAVSLADAQVIALAALHAYRTRPAPETAGAVHPQSLHGLVEAAGGTVVTGGGAAFTSVALAKFVVEIVAHQAPAPAQRMSEEWVNEAIRKQWANDYSQPLYQAARSFFRAIERHLAAAWGVKLEGGE